MKKSNQQEEAPKIRSSDPVVLELWVRSGGRCAFYGCNDYLLQDALTTNKAKIADIAHIVARSVDGPRGQNEMPMRERNEIENLMLVCVKCHRLIDNKKLEAEYPSELLMGYKKQHEARIKYLTELGVDFETAILRVIGNIRGDTISASDEEVRKAVLGQGKYPRFFGGDNTIEINLNALPKEVDESYWKEAIAKIDEVIKVQVVPAIENGRVKGLSIFALARIPVLMYLGHAIGDKVPVDLYQHHRSDPSDWIWRQERGVKFTYNLIQKGKNQKKVALLLSVSGKIERASLPKEISDDYFIYEIIPEDAEPNRSLLVSKETLNQFEITYEQYLRMVERVHGKKIEMSFFGAIPAPIAIICGKDIAKDIDPTLSIYDRVKDGYEFIFKIN